MFEMSHMERILNNAIWTIVVLVMGLSFIILAYYKTSMISILFLERPAGMVNNIAWSNKWVLTSKCYRKTDQMLAMINRILCIRILSKHRIQDSEYIKCTRELPTDFWPQCKHRTLMKHRDGVTSKQYQWLNRSQIVKNTNSVRFLSH